MRPTWKTMATAEPELLQLEREAIQAHGEGGNIWPAWQAIAQRLRGLVGWYGRHSEMRSVRFYEAAERHLLHCLETGQRPKRKRETFPPAWARLPAEIPT